MVNQQLLDYIKQKLQQGMSREQIKSSLIADGWQEADINEAFVSIDSQNQLSSQENISTQQFPTSFQKPVRKINKTLLAVISIVGILVVAGGIFGYFYYFRETPEKVIEKMWARLAEVKTVEFQGKIKAQGVNVPDLLGEDSFMEPNQQEPSKQTANLSFNFNGKTDINDVNNPKASFVLDIKTDALKKSKQEESILGLEVRLIDKVYYIKLNNIGLIDLSFLLNQWIKIDPEAIVNKFAPEEFKKQIEEVQKQQELTSEQEEKLRQIFAQSKVIKVTEELASEEIEGVNTHHYKFSIDKNELKKLILDINDTVVKGRTLTDKEIAEIDRDLEVIESLGSGEIWVGKKDYLPYKISWEIKEMKESEVGGEQLTATLLFRNYNKPVQIDVPSPVKNFEEIFTQLFGLFLGGMQLPSGGTQLPTPQPNLQLPRP